MADTDKPKEIKEPQITFNPRQAFRQSDVAKQWHDISASKAFMDASAAALLQMQVDMTCGGGDTSTAASNYFKLEGAKQLIRGMINLTSKTPDRPDSPTNQNLNHRV